VCGIAAAAILQYQLTFRRHPVTKPLALRATHLTVIYDAALNVAALCDASFVIAAGERVAVLGANGAGKTTLLLAAVGVIQLADGELEVCGIPVKKATLLDVRQKAGLVFQNPDDQLFMPTVYEDIAFGPRNYGVSEADIKAQVRRVLAKLNITHLENRLTGTLSGGEKRLAALAGVLVMEPSVLLLDEPTSFLDPRARRNLTGILSELPQTLVIATHDLTLAEDVCDRVILLKEGAVFADAPTADILHDAALLEEAGL
jgi:cobalt/nickel transport system ATP-binding protein